MLQVALLITEHSTAAVTHGLYDLFCSPGRDWELLVEGRQGSSAIRPILVSRDTHPLQCANGLWVTPEARLDQTPDIDVLVIPELVVAADFDLEAAYQPEIQWILQQHARGCLIATACTGALLLAESGLLEGQSATTHWSVANTLKQKLPGTTIHEKQSLLVTGANHQIIMAGGATSFLDLGIYLIARLLGVEQAMHTAKLWLIDWHEMGQQPYAALARSRQVEDPVIARCQQWIAMHYETASPVTAMVEISGLSERSFKRRFSQSTGMKPLDYVHTLRIEEAKQMLESSDIPVDLLAREVGYEDASFFSRLFKRKVGITANQYRKRFGCMRKSLLDRLPPTQL